MARKKGFVVDDDDVEYSIAAQVNEVDDNISTVDVEEDDALAIGFSVSSFQLLGEYDNEDDDDDEDQDEASEHDQVSTQVTRGPVVVETSSKNKKKKKKNRGAKPGPEEEEDIDRILAEIGGAPSVSQPAKVADLEGPAESVTSRKKRRKKGKENEETGKQDETRTDAKSTVPDKKVSRAVRGIQDKLAKIKEAEERKRREKEERLRKQEEERLRLEELERQEEERKRLKKERRMENIMQKKKEGTYLTPKQKEGQKKMEAIRNQIMANVAGGELLGESFRPPTKRPQYQKKKSKPQDQSNVAGPVQVEEEPTTKVAVTDDNKVPASLDSSVCSGAPVESGKGLRSPICCIMGHVDTGKTKLLDRIRGTDVQGGEAGGITQQIGATYFPAKNIRDRTKELKADAMLNVPGLLVIDTPGHASFTNLRSRGSGLCDIAILVVDIMHGLEPQTIESLNLLRMRDTQFIVALNKVDRLYGWIARKNAPIMKAMKQQSKNVRNEFNRRLTEIITQFKMQGLNTELYYRNQEMGETYSIVPTSAISGEGIPDLLLLLAQWTQKTMIERLTFSNKVECSVLEVKVMEGHGTSIDVVLVNGVLHEGDQIVVCGFQGAIVTSIRALLTPHPMKELRVKGTYLHHKEIKAAQGIKITAQGLEHAIAGTSLYVVGPDDDIQDIKDIAMEDMKSVMSRIDKSGAGVYVQTSTIGSLEALLEFLKSPAVSIPVSGISIGPVHKKDVMKASVMLEKKKEYGTILAFDVKVTQDARKLAKELGVNIFSADIIYHLFDQFKAYTDKIKGEEKKESADEAVFPCVLKIMPNHVFNTKAPIVLGVAVLEGTAKIGTPICVPQRQFIEIGRIASIENNHKQVAFAKKGQKVTIKITASNSEEQQKMFGRHFDMEDELVSKISRNSLDALKRHHANETTKGEKALLFKLKKLFKIP